VEECCVWLNVLGGGMSCGGKEAARSRPANFCARGGGWLCSGSQRTFWQRPKQQQFNRSTNDGVRVDESRRNDTHDTTGA
jgi:hypothetical protein